MLETEVGSRQRLVFIVGFLVCLFGGFVAFGIIQRGIDSGKFGGSLLGEAAPVSEDRAAFLAARRKWFLARKQMSEQAKSGKWDKAITIADTFLSKTPDAPIRLLRAEAMLHQSIGEGSPELAKLLDADKTIDRWEVALFQNDTKRYKSIAEGLLNSLDESKSKTLDANNTAWIVAFSPPHILQIDILKKAMRLSQRAVLQTRTEKNAGNNLALYTNTLGSIYYRMGQDKEAVRFLLESEKLQSDPFNAAFLTLAYRHQGDQKSAKVWQDRLENHLTTTFATREGQVYRHQLLLLWREIRQESTGQTMK